MTRTRPFIECSVGGNPVSDGFYKQLKSATVTDNPGQEADTVELVFADPNNIIQAPAKGSLLTVRFGFALGALSIMGQFKVDKTSSSFGEGGDEFTVSGTSADLRAELKEQGSEHHDDMTIEQIVEHYAKQHNYDAKVSPELASLKMPFIARVAQSPMDFLTRLADRNRGQFSIKGNKMLFLKRGILPTINITKSMCASGSFEIEPRSKFGKVEASYFDRPTGKTVPVSVETGIDGAARRLRNVYSSKEEAEAAAASESDRLGRATGSGHLELPGMPEMMADTPLNLSGFRPEENGAWRAGTVTHQFDEGGYFTGVDLEAPETGKD
jgi:phage protein D